MWYDLVNDIFVKNEIKHIPQSYEAKLSKRITQIESEPYLVDCSSHVINLP